MKLTDEQKQAVADWVREGLGLADIQRRLREDYGLNLTYMDTRFLVDDMDLELTDNTPSSPGLSEAQDLEKNAAVGNGGGEQMQGQSGALDQAEEPELVDDGGSGNVSVSVSKVQQPGMIVSGDVSFSDGTRAQWGLDQLGRLSLQGTPEGYQPPEADLAEFQRELQKVLQQQGF